MYYIFLKIRLQSLAELKNYHILSRNIMYIEWVHGLSRENVIRWNYALWLNFNRWNFWTFGHAENFVVICKQSPSTERWTNYNVYRKNHQKLMFVMNSYSSNKTYWSLPKIHVPFKYRIDSSQSGIILHWKQYLRRPWLVYMW